MQYLVFKLLGIFFSLYILAVSFIKHFKDLLADNALRSLQLHCTNTNCGKVNNFEGLKMYSNI
jgi:hypothetical protein